MGVGSVVGSGVTAIVSCGDIVAGGLGVGVETGGGGVAVGTGSGSAPQATKMSATAAITTIDICRECVFFITTSNRLDAIRLTGMQTIGSVRHIIHQEEAESWQMSSSTLGRVEAHAAE